MSALAGDKWRPSIVFHLYKVSALIPLASLIYFTLFCDSIIADFRIASVSENVVIIKNHLLRHEESDKIRFDFSYFLSEYKFFHSENQSNQQLTFYLSLAIGSTLEVTALVLEKDPCHCQCQKIEGA